jgi:hypothetical protein
MYIDKWWGEYFGGCDDSLIFTDYFKENEATEYTLAGILSDFNISMQELPDGFRAHDGGICAGAVGLHEDIQITINLLLDLAVVTLESLRSGSISLCDLTDCVEDNKRFTISADKVTLGYLVSILKDFCENPLEYDLAEVCDEETMFEIASQCKDVVSDLETA